MCQELSEFIDDYERMLNKETNKAETSPSFDASKVSAEELFPQIQPIKSDKCIKI